MATEFSITRRVQFAETDMAGIVHFANYFRWMEEVEHAYYRSIGLSVAMNHEGGEIGWPRVSVSCDFAGPVKFEDQIELRMVIARVGDKSFTYEVHFMKDGARFALGKITSVCVLHTPGGFQSISIPPAIRARLETGKV